jgi:hypothetical protein
MEKTTYSVCTQGVHRKIGNLDWKRKMSITDFWRAKAEGQRIICDPSLFSDP